MSTQTLDARTILRPLSHYLDHLPGHRGSRRLHPSTATRWVARGYPLPDGTRARLRAQRVGSRWLTCDLWWDYFVNTSALFDGEEHPVYLRIAPHPDGGIVLDLCDDRWGRW